MLFTFACEAAGAWGTRLSLRPLFFRRDNVVANLGRYPRRENADLRHREERTRRRDPALFATVDRFACARDDEDLLLLLAITMKPLSHDDDGDKIA
jgi:hypothetical protein